MKSCLVAFLALVGCGASSSAVAPTSTPPIPEALKTPVDLSLALEARADGVQIYECKAKKDDPAAFEWAFKAPEADLFDTGGAKIGKHYAGPTWESNDGSKVVGAVKAKVDAPDGGGIQWLLLDVKSAEGSGVLGKTAAVQRIATVGGKAPTEGCAQADTGKEARVPYKATYLFYAAK